MSFKNTLRLVALTSLVGVVASANATTTSPASMPVTLAVATSCTLGSAGPLAVSAATGGATGAINVTCSKTTPYAISLTPSNNSTSGLGSMKTATTGSLNADTVSYQLQQDKSTQGGTVWGNQAAVAAVGGAPAVGGNEVSRVGTGSAEAVPVYAYAANTKVTPDNYADTVTVSVIY